LLFLLAGWLAGWLAGLLASLLACSLDFWLPAPEQPQMTKLSSREEPPSLAASKGFHSRMCELECIHSFIHSFVHSLSPPSFWDFTQKERLRERNGQRGTEQSRKERNQTGRRKLGFLCMDSGVEEGTWYTQ